MPKPSPYHTLPTDLRISLVAHDIGQHRESRDGYVARIVARGGGFRSEKLRKWPADQLAREVVRHNLETPQDELGLMIALYVQVEPAIQIAFLDAAGVAHDQGSMVADIVPPFADAGAVQEAARGLLEKYGDDARRYLRTIALYNGDGWPGLGEMVGEWE
ncbi:MAG: hypothetical protein ACRELE_05675 [Gemmatimonadales bacterium]